jgi:hypothetical protein
MNRQNKQLGSNPISRRSVLAKGAAGLAACLHGCSSASKSGGAMEPSLNVLRVQGDRGPCRADIFTVNGDSWQYRIPETLSCREGIFKVYYHPIVEWARHSDGSISYEWSTSDEAYRALISHDRARMYGPVFIQGIRYKVIISLAPDGLDLSFKATNTSNRTFHDVTVFPCLGRPSARFQDESLERTYVLTGDGLQPVGRFDRGSADPRRTHFRVAGHPEMPFVNKPFWGEPNATIVKQGAILRVSEDGQWTIGTAWQRVAEVFYNEDAHHQCIHSAALLGDLKPGQSSTVSGRIVLVRGKPMDALLRLQFD